MTEDYAGTFAGDAAEQVLRAGRSGALLVDETSLVEVYVPITTLVVVGEGQVAIALDAKALLGGGQGGWPSAPQSDREGNIRTMSADAASHRSAWVGSRVSIVVPRASVPVSGRGFA